MNRLLLLLAAGGIFSGCFREVVIDTRALQWSNDQAIIVRDYDGWHYKFAAGEYSVTTDSNLVMVLQGKGKRYRHEQAPVNDFRGTIPFNGIESVTVTEPTQYFYATLATVAVLTGLLIWLTRLDF